MVKARNLDIYDDPSKVPQYFVEPEKESSLQNGISVVRKRTWEVADSFQGMVQSTKNAYKTVESTTNEIVAFIKTEEGFYPRAGIISLAGLTGIVLARKGGVFKKVLYSGALATAAASICYPYQTVKLAEKEWNWIISHSADFLKPSDKKEEVVTNQEVKETQKSFIENVEPTAETRTENTDGDYGQSNPADKDLYTTRS